MTGDFWFGAVCGVCGCGVLALVSAFCIGFFALGAGDPERREPWSAE